MRREQQYAASRGLRGLQVFFWEPVKTPYALGELALKATPLLLIALGLAVCFRSNVWNIGAEGQYVIGAVAGAGVALLADSATGGWMCGLTTPAFRMSAASKPPARPIWTASIRST